MKREELDELLKRYGSRSIEYRRAWRKEYRESNYRLDYTPDRAALAALKLVMQNGWALSYTDAINRALAEWVRE